MYRQDSLEVKRIFLGTRHDKEARFVLPHRDCDVPGGGIDGARGPAPRSIHQVHDEACYSSLCVRLVKFLARDHAVLVDIHTVKLLLNALAPRRRVDGEALKGNGAKRGNSGSEAAGETGKHGVRLGYGPKS